MQKWKLEKDMDGEVEEESRGTERAGREPARALSRLTGRLGRSGCD